MKMYYLKMLLFNFLINTLVLPHYENYLNNHYNVRFKQNCTQKATIKSRLLAQKQNHNPHYHNDPELKEIIDKMNEEAIKKYQQTHDPYKQLKEVVEENGRKLTSRNVAEPLSTLEKELLETYEEMFREENNIILKSGMYTNDDDKSDKYSSCECADTDNTKLAKSKGKDKYLKHLKYRCTRGICFCSVGSSFLTLIGLAAAKKAALAILAKYTTDKACLSSIVIYNVFDRSTILAAIQTASKCASFGGAPDAAGTAVGSAMGALYPWGIAALVLIILAVVLIILYIWLYKRRKNSLKHECKKHLCK